MQFDRRGFLRVGGLGALGVAAIGGWDVASKAKAKAGDTRPAPGELAGKKWGMAVDLKKCWKRNGCAACIEACHAIHNVPEVGNVKDEVKWIWKVPYEKAFPEHLSELGDGHLRMKDVLVLCNQCDDPPCVKYCPTRATWKREDGLVMIDFHRCIGCRYCMAGCPYGARSFNWRDPRPFIKNVNTDFPTRTKGVVEKCNLCEERLIKGLVPACVEACKERALVFGDLNDARSEVRRALGSNHVIRRQVELGAKPRIYYIA
jgi:molybdopterin-containing oxidoreductase family iron-sulfur binding subunit